MKIPPFPKLPQARRLKTKKEKAARAERMAPDYEKERRFFTVLDKDDGIVAPEKKSGLPSSAQFDE